MVENQGLNDAFVQSDPRPWKVGDRVVHKLSGDVGYIEHIDYEPGLELNYDVRLQTPFDTPSACVSCCWFAENVMDGRNVKPREWSEAEKDAAEAFYEMSWDDMAAAGGGGS